MWNRKYEKKSLRPYLLILALPCIVQSHLFAQPPLRRPPLGPYALLLRKMLRPTADYAGEQVTEVTDRGGRTSRQRVYGDEAGRVRREFFAPESLSGDVMITAPDRYQYYHKRTNVLDVAFWPSEQTERPQQLLKRIAGGGLQVERLGEESIAGRTAIILLVSPRNPNPNAHSVKLWLDSEAGILLKMETSNRNGLISRTYFTTITVGESANVRPRLFEPPSERNTVLNPLLPPQPTFPTLEAAQGKLPFVPLIPTNLPKGYQVTGVWAVQPERIGGRRPALILRYSDGAGTFTLFERLLPPPLQPINPDKKPIRRHKGMVHWVVPNPDGTLTALTFIGHLPPEQVEALRSSLR